MFGFAKYLWLLLIFCTIFDCGRSQTLVTKTNARIVTYTIPELKENREVLKNIVHEEIFVHTKTNERIRGYLDSIQMDSLVVRLDKNNGEKYSIHERNVSFIALRVNGGGIEAHKLVEMIGVVLVSGLLFMLSTNSVILVSKCSKQGVESYFTLLSQAWDRDTIQNGACLTER